MKRITTLSTREQEVADLLSKGRRVTDIAKDLRISLKTVSTYKTRAERKKEYAKFWSKGYDAVFN